MGKVLLVGGEANSKFLTHVSGVLSELSPKKYELKTVDCSILSGHNGAGKVQDIVVISPGIDAKKVLAQLSEAGYISGGSSVVIFDSALRTKELCELAQIPINIFRVTDPCKSWRLPISYVIANKCAGVSGEVASEIEKLLGYIYTEVHFVCDENAFDQAPLFCKNITSLALILKGCLEKITAAKKVDSGYDSSTLIGNNIFSIGNLLISKDYSSEDLSAAVCTPNGITAAFCSSLKRDEIHNEIRELLQSLSGISASN